MAMTSCPECENSVSDKAPMCPHCGYEVRRFFEQALQHDDLIDPTGTSDHTITIPASENARTDEHAYAKHCITPDTAFKLGAFGNRFGYIMTTISALWSLALVYQSVGLFGLIIAILLLPITIFCTPISPVIRNGDWTLFVLSYGSWWLASSINVVAMSLAFSDEMGPPETRKLLQKKFLARRLATATLCFLVVPLIAVFMLSDSRDDRISKTDSQEGMLIGGNSTSNGMQDSSNYLQELTSIQNPLRDDSETLVEQNVQGASVVLPTQVQFYFSDGTDSIERFDWLTVKTGNIGARVLLPSNDVKVTKIEGPPDAIVYQSSVDFDLYDIGYSVVTYIKPFSPDLSADYMRDAFLREATRNKEFVDGYDLETEVLSTPNPQYVTVYHEFKFLRDNVEVTRTGISVFAANSVLSMGVDNPTGVDPAAVRAIEFFKSLQIGPKEKFQ